MFNSFFKFISGYLAIIIILSLFIFYFVIQTSSSFPDLNNFVWPLDGYTYISSYFGYRLSPASGASTYHSGIDIPAPEGTSILAVCPGIVTFASWGAGGGYTIVIENNDIKISYCHLSPNFIVAKNDMVTAGQIISNVGPKNVYGIINNPYKDSLGNPTNGATTGCHLHLTIKKDGLAVNPLDYFTKEI